MHKVLSDDITILFRNYSNLYFPILNVTISEEFTICGVLKVGRGTSYCFMYVSDNWIFSISYVIDNWIFSITWNGIYTMNKIKILGGCSGEWKLYFFFCEYSLPPLHYHQLYVYLSIVIYLIIFLFSLDPPPLRVLKWLEFILFQFHHTKYIILLL
jgi:hypothetical protein